MSVMDFELVEDEAQEWKRRAFPCLSKIYILFCIAIYSGFALSAEVSQIHIELKTNVVLRQNDVRLRDLAIVRCSNPALAARLGNIKMGHTPWPGNVRRIDRDVFRMRLREKGIDLHRVSFSGADSVLLSVKSVKLTGQKIADFAKRYLLSRLPWTRDEVVVELRGGVPRDLILPAPPVVCSEPRRRGKGDSPLLLRSSASFLLHASPLKGNKLIGEIQVEVGIYLYRMASVRSSAFHESGPSATPAASAQLGKLLLRVPLHFYVRVFKNVVVAKRDIQRSELLSEENVFIKRMEITNLIGSPFYKIRELTDKVATQPIQALAIITRRMVDIPALIKRRDIVIVLVANGALEITAKGQALEDGHKNDVIRVRNLRSGKEVLARVVDSRRVQIIF